MERGVTLGVLCLAAACGAPPPSAPSAVVTSSPETVCLGDAFRTEVTLDGSESSPRLTLVSTAESTAGLSFEWRLSGSDRAIVSGAIDEPVLVVRMRGDRPLHAELTVRDDAGHASMLYTVSVTECDP